MAGSSSGSVYLCGGFQAWPCLAFSSMLKCFGEIFPALCLGIFSSQALLQGTCDGTASLSHRASAWGSFSGMR